MAQVRQWTQEANLRMSYERRNLRMAVLSSRALGGGAAVGACVHEVVFDLVGGDTQPSGAAERRLGKDHVQAALRGGPEASRDHGNRKRRPRQALQNGEGATHRH